MSGNALTGGLSNYYLAPVEFPQRKSQVPYVAECEDITQALKMTPDEFCEFKAIWRTAAARLGNGKPGTKAVYDAEKRVHYAGRSLLTEQRAAGIEPSVKPVPVPATEWQLDGKTFARLMTSVTAGLLKMDCTNSGEMPRDYRLPIETFILDGVDVHFWNPDGLIDPSKTTEPAMPEEKPLEKLSNSIPELQDMFKELIEKTAMDKSQVKPLLKVNPGISSLQLKPVNVEPTDK